ncbi:microtubule-associated protein tau-like isoform X1 [Trichomycterus rosablanca]|uniref:microtubule-associated protein tau-like isoform X1 n=1 Tax=Trichomycterus rosablanca TaxID=2290929 RepID=UPI002F354D74
MDFKSDIHTFGVPMPGQDSLLKKDVVAGQDAKSLDSKVGGSVDKKEGFGFISGGLTESQFSASLGENHTSPFEKKLSNSDVSGFSQPGKNLGGNMNVGMAPFQSTIPPSKEEPQKTSSLHTSQPLNPFEASSKPSDTSPHNAVDKPAVKGGSWTGQDMFSHSPNKTEQDFKEALYAQGVQDEHKLKEEPDEDEAVKQKRKKCDSTDDGFGLLESLRSPEKTQSKSSDQDDFSPTGDGENWKSEIREWGGGRIQAKKSKSRMKLPEEWASLADPTSTSPPPGYKTDLNVDDFSLDKHETKIHSNICGDQEAASLITSHQSASLSATSQANAISPSNKPDPSQNNQTNASLNTSPTGHDALADSIHSPDISVLTGPSTSVSSSTVASKIPADPDSLTSLKEPLLAKSLQLKAREDIVKEKVEKVDTPSKTDKPENTAKIEDFTKKEDDTDKIQSVKEQDNKTEMNEKNKKVDQVEQIKKEVKEEKKNGSEKVDKTVKNEKNVKAAKETTKPSPANGTKVLTSPDKPKTKPISTKPNLKSPEDKSSAATPNSVTKKAPVPKKTTPTATTRKPPATTEAKNSENGTPAKRKPPVPKFSATATKRKTNGSSVKSPTNGASGPDTPATDGTPAPRPSRITKPPVPKQVPLPRKPPVPRSPRSGQASNTPTQDLKKVSSKIGSKDNMKYQPGGGKIQIVHKKLDFSHVTSRCGSKDNIKHVPGGGNVQITNKKVDVSKVTSKCGSKDNKQKSDDENEKTEALKTKNNAEEGSKESGNNLSGGESIKTTEDQQKSEGSPPAPTNPPIPTVGGLKDNKQIESSAVPQSALSAGDGLSNSQSLDKRIPATN